MPSRDEGEWVADRAVLSTVWGAPFAKGSGGGQGESARQLWPRGAREAWRRGVRRVGAEGRESGLVEGREAGLAEGRAEELAAAVTGTLEARGISVRDDLSDAVVDLPRDAVVAAGV